MFNFVRNFQTDFQSGFPIPFTANVREFFCFIVSLPHRNLKICHGCLRSIYNDPIHSFNGCIVVFYECSVTKHLVINVKFLTVFHYNK